MSICLSMRVAGMNIIQDCAQFVPRFLHRVSAGQSRRNGTRSAQTIQAHDNVNSSNGSSSDSKTQSLIEIREATLVEAMRESDAAWQVIQHEIKLALRPDLCESRSVQSRDLKELALLITSQKRLQDGRRQALVIADGAGGADDDSSPSPGLSAVLERLAVLDAAADDDDGER